MLHLMNVDLKFAKTESDSLMLVPPLFLKRQNDTLMRTPAAYIMLYEQFFDLPKGEFRLCGVMTGVGGRSYMNYLKVPARVGELCTIL